MSHGLEVQNPGGNQKGLWSHALKKLQVLAIPFLELPVALFLSIQNYSFRSCEVRRVSQQEFVVLVFKLAFLCLWQLPVCEAHRWTRVPVTFECFHREKAQPASCQLWLVTAVAQWLSAWAHQCLWMACSCGSASRCSLCLGVDGDQLLGGDWRWMLGLERPHDWVQGLGPTSPVLSSCW